VRASPFVGIGGGEARFFRGVSRGVASPLVGFGGARGGLTERERFGGMGSNFPNDERFIGSKVDERFIGSKVLGRFGKVGRFGGVKRFIDNRWAGPMDGSMVCGINKRGSGAMDNRGSVGRVMLSLEPSNINRLF